MILDIPFTPEEEQKIRKLEGKEQLIKSFLLEKAERKAVSAANIRLFLTDCDGCLTDSGMYYTEKGDELKKFHTRDGYGFGRFRNAGILTGILTAENTELNRRRGEKMRLNYIFQGCFDKPKKIREIAEELHISLDQIAYMGDDFNDIKALKMVGISFAPADAIPQAKAAATYVLKTKGGQGTVREIAEMLFGEIEEF